MPGGEAKGEIRVISESARPETGSDRPPVLVAVGLLAVIAVCVVLLSRVTRGGGEATGPLALADPVSSTAQADLIDPTPLSTGPLDGLVPGFTQTLVMTTGPVTPVRFPLSSGRRDGPLEVWIWASGPEGLVRIATPDGGFDARPDPWGVRVAALSDGNPGSGDYDRRVGETDSTSWLVMTDPGRAGPLLGGLVPVVRGVRSFAWHATKPGEIAWIAGNASTAAYTLYAATTIDQRLESRRVVDLPGLSPMITSLPGDRIVAYDAAGFVLQIWTRRDGIAVPIAERFDASGRLVLSVEGFILDVAPDGRITLSDRDATDVIDTARDMVIRLPGDVTSAVWSPAGDRLATTSAYSSTVIIADLERTIRRSIDVDVEQVTVKGWSTDGRFLIVSGRAIRGIRYQPSLVFIDTVANAVWSIPIDATPAAIVATP